MRINYRFAGKLLLAVACTGIGVHFLHDFQVGRHASVYLREARRTTESNPRQSLQFFQRYIGLVPKDVEALEEYGVMLADQGAPDRAYFILQRALRIDPERPIARKRWIEVAMQLERFLDIKSTLLLDSKSNKDAASLALLARCEEELGNFEGAIAGLKAAIAADPHHLDSYQQLARVFSEHKEDPHTAREWLDEMIAQNKDSFAAYVTRGNWQLDHPSQQTPTNAKLPLGANELVVANRADLKQAEADALTAAQLAPDDPTVNYLSARVAMLHDRFEDARRLALLVIEKDQKNVAAYQLLTNAELQLDDSAAALKHLRSGLAAMPADTTLRWTLANLLIELGFVPEAQNVIAELERLRYPNAALEVLAARLLMVDRQWLAAVAKIEKVRGELVKWPELDKQAQYWLGEAYGQLANVDEQLAAYQRALEIDASWTPARQAIADTLASTGQRSKAKDELRRLVQSPRASDEAIIKYARLSISEAASLPNRDEVFAQIEQNLKEYEKTRPELGFATILRAEMLVTQGKRQEADELLNAACDKLPGRVELWLARLASAQYQQKWDACEALLPDLHQRFPNESGMWMAHAKYFVSRYAAAAGPHVTDLYARANKELPEAARIAVAENFALLTYWMEDHEAARGYALAVIKSQPENLQMLLLLLQVACHENNLEQMQSILADLRKIEGEGAIWHYGEAVRLTLLAQTDGGESLLIKAQQHLVVAEKLRPTWSKAIALAAEIHAKQGESELAIKRYRDALALGERERDLVRHYMGVLFKVGRHDEVDRLHRQMTDERQPFLHELAEVAAHSAYQAGKLERAFELTQAYPEAFRGPESQVWLGQLLSALNRPTDAEAEFRQAVTQSPQAIAPWIAYVAMLLRAENPERARAILVEAEAAVAQPQLPVLRARCYELLNEPELAKTHYREALNLAPTDLELKRAATTFYLKTGLTSEAETALHEIMASEQAGSAGQLWARRTLAWVLANGRGEQGTKQALALIEQNLAKPPAHKDDLRIKATILAAAPIRSKRLEAAQLLESLTKRDPSDDFLLAKLYLRDRSWEQARPVLRSLASLAPGDRKYIAGYIDGLLDNDEISEAEVWLNQLKRDGPRTQVDIGLEAKLLFKLNKHSMAVDTLSSWARGPAAGQNQQPADKGQSARWFWVAGMLEQLSEWAQPIDNQQVRELYAAEAAAVYNQHIAPIPGSQLTIAAFQARQGQPDAAIKILESRGGEVKPVEIAALAITILSKSKPDEDTLARLQGALDGTLESHGRGVPLLLASADLQSWRKNYQAAASLYREVLSAEPENLHAMNNLAVVLALADGTNSHALELAEQTLKIAGLQGNLLDTRGFVRLRAGQLEQAFEDFTEAVAEESTPDRQFHLALAAHRLGKRELARDTFDRACALGLTHWKVHPGEHPDLKTLGLQFD